MNRVLRGGLGILAGCGVATLTLHSYGWRILTDSRPMSALTGTAPSVPIYKLAFAEFLQNNAQVSPGTLGLVRQSIPRTPVAADPLFIMATDARAKGDLAREERLLLLSRQRAPRNRLTRLLLIERYLNSGRSKEAAVEIAAIVRLMPKSDELLLPKIAQLALDPKSAEATREALAGTSLLDRMLGSLVKNGTPTQTILDLGRYSAMPPSYAARGWQSALQRRLVGAGDVQTAVKLWRHYNGIERGNEAVYDARFAGKPGPAPFNWTFSSGKAGAVETRKPGLLVESYGRLNATLAWQTLVLKPGSYTLEIMGDGEIDPTSGVLSWSIRCETGKQVFVVLPVSTLVPARPVAKNFTVPPSCPGQRLELITGLGDLPLSQTVEFGSVRIIQDGAAR